MYRSHLYFLALAGLFACQQNTSSPHQPAPTELAPNVEEGSDAGSAREAWIDYMHKTREGVSWRSIEATNRTASIERLRSLKRNTLARGVRADSIAPGLYGTWQERGSSNQAGSVLATVYDAPSDEVYAISAGGTLWAGPSDGSAWRVVNQELQFDARALLLIDIPTGGKRLISGVDSRPAYSDDLGATWTITEDLAIARNGWSYLRDVCTVSDAGGTRLYARYSEGYWERNELIFSDDLGQSWQVYVDPGLELSHLEEHFAIASPTQTSELIVLDYDGRISAVTRDSIRAIGSHPGSFNSLRLSWSKAANDVYLYTYDVDLNVYVSSDQGANWSQRGTLPVEPWSVGIYAHPTNPDRLVMGAVEAYTSFNGGLDWTRVNTWGAYYRDVEGSLHADMMTFNTFTRSDGSTFTLSANHGGLNSTENWFTQSQNIGLDGLNVGQFYSVAYHERYPDHLFVGTQDQGFQRGIGSPDEIIPMEQVISGDYGHLTFNRDGSELWMMYPGTAVSVYDDPEARGLADWLTIDSQDETVWLAPMAAHPHPDSNIMLAAGGSIVDDGNGSYLLKFSLDPQTRTIEAREGSYDFVLEAGGTISAVETSPLSDSRVFVATDNGRFFLSEDAGQTWEQSISFIPGGHYLYGQAIAASPVSDSTLWVAGSGYSGPGVFRTDDLGETWSSDVEGLPSTMIFELASSPDGSWLYAATEAGPYALNVAERQWYPLAVPGVPTQTYWSVAYVTLDSTVRFGTYGRGAWDLALQAPPDTVDVSTRHLVDLEVSVFPNPATATLIVRSDTPLDELTLVDLQGREVLTAHHPSAKTELAVGHLPRGTYVLVATDKLSQFSQRVVLK